MTIICSWTILILLEFCHQVETEEELDAWVSLLAEKPCAQGPAGEFSQTRRTLEEEAAAKKDTNPCVNQSISYQQHNMQCKLLIPLIDLLLNFLKALTLRNNIKLKDGKHAITLA